MSSLVPSSSCTTPTGTRPTSLGATFETRNFTGDLKIDDAGETAALRWWPDDALPRGINPYNRLILRRARLEA
ncbi:MAG: hypothetical protein WA966_12805 [Ornithinimicrobium sp.]